MVHFIRSLSWEGKFLLFVVSGFLLSLLIFFLIWKFIWKPIQRRSVRLRGNEYNFVTYDTNRWARELASSKLTDESKSKLVQDEFRYLLNDYVDGNFLDLPLRSRILFEALSSLIVGEEQFFFNSGNITNRHMRRALVNFLAGSSIDLNIRFYFTQLFFDFFNDTLTP